MFHLSSRVNEVSFLIPGLDKFRQNLHTLDENFFISYIRYSFLEIKRNMKNKSLPEHCSQLDARQCSSKSPSNNYIQRRRIELLCTWLNNVPFGQRNECRTIPEAPRNDINIAHEMSHCSAHLAVHTRGTSGTVHSHPRIILNK